MCQNNNLNKVVAERAGSALPPHIQKRVQELRDRERSKRDAEHWEQASAWGAELSRETNANDRRRRREPPKPPNHLQPRLNTPPSATASRAKQPVVGMLPRGTFGNH